MIINNPIHQAYKPRDTVKSDPNSLYLAFLAGCVICFETTYWTIYDLIKKMRSY